MLKKEESPKFGVFLSSRLFPPRRKRVSGHENAARASLLPARRTSPRPRTRRVSASRRLTPRSPRASLTSTSTREFALKSSLRARASLSRPLPPSATLPREFSFAPPTTRPLASRFVPHRIVASSPASSSTTPSSARTRAWTTARTPRRTFSRASSACRRDGARARATRGNVSR